MLTVITTMKLMPGAAPECDAMIHERFQSAHDRPGWVSGQLLTPIELSDVRVIVGTWRSREDWEAWHDDPAFLDKRNALEQLQAEPNVTAWYEIIDHARADAG